MVFSCFDLEVDRGRILNPYIDRVILISQHVLILISALATLETAIKLSKGQKLVKFSENTLEDDREIEKLLCLHADFNC